MKSLKIENMMAWMITTVEIQKEREQPSGAIQLIHKWNGTSVIHCMMNQNSNEKKRLLLKLWQVSTKTNIIKDLNIKLKVENCVKYGLLNSHTSTFKRHKNTLMQIWFPISVETQEILNQFGVTLLIQTRDGNIVMNLMQVIQKVCGVTKLLSIKESKP